MRFKILTDEIRQLILQDSTIVNDITYSATAPEITV